MRKPAVRLPVEEKVRVVLAVLAGETTASEAARRHGVSTNAVLSWRGKFLDAGRPALEDKISGPGEGAGTAEERRRRVEANQPKLEMAEATVQLRIWQKGAEYVYQVLEHLEAPESGSRPAGFEVRPSRGDPPPHPPSTPGPVARRRCGKGPVADTSRG